MRSNSFTSPAATPLPRFIFATPPAALTSVPAGAYLGVTRKTLSNWRALGEGPPYARLGEVGSRIVYRIADLDRFLDEHMIGVVR